ncbi:MAG: xanthine dehydrogenase accessory protein XdhC [Bauldia sp.]
MAVWDRVLAAIDRHGRAAMVTVAATRGSAPREAGARLIVHPDGTFTGTIGGGTLEWRAIAIAQAGLADPRAKRAEVRSFALGPELGQCCGGRVELVVELIDRGARHEVAGLAERERQGRLVTRGTISPAAGVERRVVDGIAMEPGGTTFEAGILMEEFGDDRRNLILFGAGHVGRALALALAPLPFKLTWADPRPDAFPARVPANVTLHLLGDPAAALSGAPAGSFVVVMSHSHQLDLALVHAALADPRFAYVGLIGSKSKPAPIERQLAAAGVPSRRIAELVCPIGVAGIASKEPAVIAAATAAELLIRDAALRAAVQPAEDRAPSRLTGGQT